MNHTRMTTVTLTAVLGAALAASVGAQQDSSGAKANSAARALQTAPRALRLRSGAPAQADGPRLGVMVQQTPDGLLVTEVLPGSLAETLGVLAQDILLRVDDERIESVVDVQRAMSAQTPAAPVSVAVIREGEGIVLLSGVMPEAAPPDSAPRAQAPHAPAPPAYAPPAQALPDDAPQFAPQPWAPAPDDDGAFRSGFLGVQLAPEAAADTSRTDGAHATDNIDDADNADDTQGADDPDTDTHHAGVAVAAVIPESAAWFAGLQPGDRLLSVDGTPLAANQDLIGAVSGMQAGSFVELTWLRDGEQHTTRVRLGERQAGGALGDMLPGLRMLPFDGQGGGFGGAAPTFPRLRSAPPGIPGPGGSPHGFSFADMPPLPGGLQPQDGMLRLQDLHQQIQQFLNDLDLDAMGTQRQSVRVDIRNGRGTLSVTRDGDTEAYTLDEQGHWNKSSTPDDAH